HEDHARRLSAAEKGAAKDPPLALELAWELGQLYDERLHRPDDAELAWKRVLVIDPDHDAALRALERHYRAAERYAEPRALLSERKARALDPAAKRDLLFQICDLDEGVLEDPSAAAASYSEVLEVDPGSQRAFKALERIYTTRERWMELDDLYRRAVDGESQG